MVLIGVGTAVATVGEANDHLKIHTMQHLILVAPPSGAAAIGVGANIALGSAGAGITGATTGGIVGGAVAGGVTNVVAGSATLPAMGAMAAMGPVGWIGIGMMGADNDGLSWDCWKPVLHDKSTAPSSGMPMKEVLSDPRVKKITVDGEKVTLVNVWDEKFQVTYFDIPGFGIATHAAKLEE